MNTIHQESRYLYQNILNIKIQNCINEFIVSEVESKEDYNSLLVWKCDQKIGGIGAYAMNPNPIHNPFPSGVERSLYRPLQYARSDIEYCDIRIHARYIVLNSGLHLEAVCKVILSHYKPFGKMRYNTITLGKSVHSIEKIGIISEEMITALYHFVKLYNQSKHEVNQDESIERLFNAYDALIAYFSARIIGLYLLRIINYPKSNDEYTLIENSIRTRI